MRVVRVHAAAAEEAAEAAAWYEKERPGLGSEFGQAIDAALDLLERRNHSAYLNARFGRGTRRQAAVA